MLKKYFRLNVSFPLILIVVALSTTVGCKTQGSRTAKQQKAVERRMEERKKKEAAAYDKAKARHRKIQSAGGKNLLAGADSHSQSLDKRQGKKKRFFLWRWLYKDADQETGCN